MKAFSARKRGQTGDAKCREAGDLMRDIEKEIRDVNGTMALEGLPLTDEDKENMRAVLRGDVTFRAMERKIMAKYRPKFSKHDRPGL
jgi:hypothetical protein